MAVDHPHYPNPFHSNIVLTPWEPIDVDVTEIHAAAFESCVRLVTGVQARAQNPAAGGGRRSLLLNGPKGSGKTHLMARLCHYLTRMPPAARNAPPVVFTWVRLNTTAGRLWRHLRQVFVEDLFDHPRGGKSQLKRVLEFHVPGLGEEKKSWLGIFFPSSADKKTAQYHELAQRAGLSAATRDALAQVYGDWPLDVRDWLRGGRLPEARLEQLHLKGVPGGGTEPGETDEAAEERAKQAVLELCRLAGPRVPVVFCFDQIEALGPADRSEAALGDFGTMVSALHDLSENVVVITCVQSAQIIPLKRAVREADWDRLAGSEGTLNLFKAPDALTLIRKRMAGLDIPELKERQAKGEPDWPFGEATVRQWFGQGSRTARDVLGYCADVFEREVNRRQPPARDSLTDFLTGNWVERLRIAQNGPPPEHSDLVYRDALPSLASLWPQEPQLVRAGPLRDQLTEVDMIFATADGAERVGVALCNQNARWLPNKLKALREQWDPKQLHKLVLLRDEGWPRRAGARETNQQLEALGDAVRESFSPEEIVALQVFVDLLRSAESQGLLNGDQMVSAEEVRRWLRQQMEAGQMKPLEKARRLFAYGEFKKREAAKTQARQGERPE
jgi:hypothetical protein